MTSSKLKFRVNDYMTAPNDKRYQLLDGEMVVAPAPSDRHQAIVVRLLVAMFQFVSANGLGQVRVSPYDVVLSEYDVTQPDILFVSNARAGIITEANIRGAPDLVVEVLSPGTAQYDRGYKRTLYSRSGVLECWLVDPEAQTVEVLAVGDQGLELQATYHRDQSLHSRLLPDFALDLGTIFE